MSSALVVEIQRRDVAVEEFLQAVQAMIGLAEAVASEMAIRRKPKWIIRDLRAGSASLRAEPADGSSDERDVQRVLKEVGQGVASLQRSARRPRYFTDKALEYVSTLGRISTAQQEGSARLVIGKVEIRPNESLEAHVTRLTVGREVSLGSIEGELIGVSNTDGLVIYVRDRLRNVRVRCDLRPDLLRRALQSFGHRVQVTGRVWWRTDGVPKKVDVDRLVPMASDDALPAESAVRGVLAASGAGTE